MNLMDGICFCEKCGKCCEHVFINYDNTCSDNKTICKNCSPNAAEFLYQLISFLEKE